MKEPVEFQVRVYFEEPELEQIINELVLAAERPWLVGQAKRIEYKGATDERPPKHHSVGNRRLEGAPEWDESYLYGVVGELVDFIKDWTEAPPVSLYTTLLSLAGNRIAPGAWFAIGDKRHHTRLWVVLLGGTGVGRKGTSGDVAKDVIATALPDEDPLDYIREGLSTTEGLGELIEKLPLGDGKIVVFEDEFARYLTVKGRDGNTVAYVIRKLWDGSVLQNFSKSSWIDIRHAHLTFIGHMTKEEYELKATVADIFSGSFNRFVWFYAERLHLIPNTKGLPLEGPTLSSLCGRLADAIEFGRELGQVRLSMKAQNLWERVYLERSRTHPAGQLGKLTERWDAQILRLALTFAVLDQRPRILTQHLAAAAHLFDYSMASASLLCGFTTGSPVSDKILAALKATSPLKQSYVQTRVLGGNATAEHMNAALAVLEKYGVWRAADVNGQYGRVGSGRRPLLWHLDETRAEE